MAGTSGQSPAHVTHYLRGIDFPVNKQDLVKHAKGQQADKEVIDVLEQMPDAQYANMADVMKGVGQVG